MPVKIYSIRKNVKKIFIISTILIILTGIHVRLNLMSSHKVVTDNSIKLGIINNYPPVIFDAVGVANEKDMLATENGNYISGSDVLFFKKLCDELNKKLIIKTYDSITGLLSDLDSSKITCCMGMMNITPARQLKYDSIPYFRSDIGVLVRKNDSSFDKYNDKSPLQFPEFKEKYLKTKKIATLKDSTFDLDRTIISQDYTKESYKNQFSCLDYLKQGLVDAFILDDLAINAIGDMQSKDFKAIKLKKDKKSPLGPLGIFFKKTDSNNFKSELISQMKRMNLIIDDKNNTVYNDKVYNDCYQRAIGIYKQTPKNNNFFKNLLTYEKGLYYSLLLAIYGLILGFPLALFCFKIQILSLYNSNNRSFYTMLQKIFSYIIDLFINFFKAVPTIIQTLFIYNLLIRTNLNIFKMSLGSMYAALIIIALNTAFNLIFIMVNHAKFLDKGQIEAAYALGMNQKQVFKYIVFEQTLKRVIPSLWIQFIVNIKESSLFSIIGLPSLLWSAESNAAITYDTITPFLIVSAIYLFLTFFTNTLNKFVK